MWEHIMAMLPGRAEPPCLSLYQPTHRHHPDNLQDPIRFRNLLKELETSLKQKYAPDEVRRLLQPFGTLAEDRDFWNHTRDGLAVFGAPDGFRVNRLQRPVPELALVADSFHVKPLLRLVQSADRYQVLGLNRREWKLFEGNRDALDEVDPLPSVPRTLVATLGEEKSEPHLTVASYGQGAAGPAMHHGHGSRKDEVDVDAERFFRAADQAVLEHHSKPSGLPLLLAALPEHHHLFRRVSRNPFLLEEALEIHPDDLGLEALRERAWRVIEPRYRARLADHCSEFQRVQAQGRGTDDLAEVARAAAAGRVATLLLEAERQAPGRIDAASGEIVAGQLAHPEIDDLLDDLGEMVLRRNGQVVVIEAAAMPSRTGLAAIYRY